MPPKPKIPVITPQPKSQPPVEEKKEPRISRNSRIIRDYVVAEAPKRKPAVQKSAEDSGLKTGVQPETKVTEIDQKIQDETAAMKQRIAELEKTIAAVEKGKQAAVPEVAPSTEKEESVEVVTESNVEQNIPADEEVAQKIAAFAKELALVCPICKKGILQEKSTAAGKIFYACEGKNCNFISWGRPHNISCARCKNPFLIEVTDAAGKTVLRCPRATCQHRQSLTSGGVKVVRKRLVRRQK